MQNWRETKKPFSLINSSLSNNSKFIRLITPKVSSQLLFTNLGLSSTRAISGAAADPMTPKKENDREQTPQNWKIKMLFDGDCPLCMQEVDMLRERNKRYGTIKFVDISSDDYSPEENQGLDYKTVSVQ